jgi:ubiquinone biosynthesis protein
MPWPKLALRTAAIAFAILASIFVYAVRRLALGLASHEEVERLRGDRLACLLEGLGATFVKFGQVLSSRPDLLGPGIIEGLSRLQDRVPPAPFDQVELVLSEELGPQGLVHIAEIDPTPLAAASVAQVHAGRLDTGQRVAIKVQRIEAAGQIERDLVLMGIFARLLHRIPSVGMLSLPGAVERFGDAMRSQLDFEKEAANNRRFARNFAHVDGIAVPELFPSLCTRRVLVMELIDGVRATEPEKVGGDRSRLARVGLDAVLQMVFEHGFVHADMHPGNILLTRDKVVLIDLGLVAEIPQDLLRPYVETFLALAAADGKKAASLFYTYAPTVATKDYAAFEREVMAHFEGLRGKRLGDVEASEVLGGIMNVLRRHRVQMDSTFTVVHIALLVAEGLGKQLDPTLDVIQLALPYLSKAVLTAGQGRAPAREVPAIR